MSDNLKLQLRMITYLKKKAYIYSRIRSVIYLMGYYHLFYAVPKYRIILGVEIDFIRKNTFISRGELSVFPTRGGGGGW